VETLSPTQRLLLASSSKANKVNIHAIVAAMLAAVVGHNVVIGDGGACVWLKNKASIILTGIGNHIRVEPNAL
jgi:UDP-3-O-[3-hydroxymyristoyl] glucosamine N-acyltransferase